MTLLEELEVAVFRGRIRRVTELAAAGAPINALLTPGVPALLYAAGSGQVAHASRMLAAGADPNLCDAHEGQHRHDIPQCCNLAIRCLGVPGQTLHTCLNEMVAWTKANERQLECRANRSALDCVDDALAGGHCAHDTDGDGPPRTTGDRRNGAVVGARPNRACMPCCICWCRGYGRAGVAWRRGRCSCPERTEDVGHARRTGQISRPVWLPSAAAAGTSLTFGARAEHHSAGPPLPHRVEFSPGARRRRPARRRGGPTRHWPIPGSGLAQSTSVCLLRGRDQRYRHCVRHG
jgi:hypothetical protein